MPLLCTHYQYQCCTQDGNKVQPVIPQYVKQMIDIKLPFVIIKAYKYSYHGRMIIIDLCTTMPVCGSEERLPAIEGVKSTA